MKNEKWTFNWKDLFTVANMLTYLRFILIAPFMYFFIHENYLAAAICIGVSGLSDCFDGVVARKLNQVTALGKTLDPIADKLTLISVAVCMLIYMPSLLPLMLILVVKDTLMLTGGLILLTKKIAPPLSKWYGKAATVIFYLSVFLIIFHKAVFHYENPTMQTVLFIITALAMLFALSNYIKMFIDITREDKLQKAKENGKEEK